MYSVDKKVIPLVQCNVMFERYHFFGPPCISQIAKVKSMMLTDAGSYKPLYPHPYRS